MRNRLAIAVVILAFVGGIAIAIALGMLVARRVPRPAVLPTATVVQQIQSLSELVTVKYVLEKVVVYDDPKYFANIVPLGENRLILLAHGVVKAGVDLSRLGRDDVEVAETRISIALPPATLTDAYLDEKRTQVIDRQTGLLRQFDKNLEQTARQYALAEMQRGARAQGIEREADQRAREQLATLLRTLGFTEVEIRSRPNAEAPHRY